MKKFFDVVKFFVAEETFLFALLFALILRTVAVYAITILFVDGCDLTITFNAFVFSLSSLFSLVVGIRETANLYKGEQIRKYYAHLDNLEKSGEWACI